MAPISRTNDKLKKEAILNFCRLGNRTKEQLKLEIYRRAVVLNSEIENLANKRATRQALAKKNDLLFA